MGATLQERRHELAVPYLSERPYQSGNTRSLAIFASERPPRATGRSRSSSRATSPQRHPEVTRGCVDLRVTYKPGATSHSDYLRLLPAPRATSQSDVPRSLSVYLFGRIHVFSRTFWAFHYARFYFSKPMF